MRPWIVTPHQPIVEHEANLWSVESPVPTIKGMNRRMAIARLGDGRLVFYNAVPVDDASLEKLRAWGKPWLLVIPHPSHMLDAHAFQEKLGLTTCAPEHGLEKVRSRVPSAVPMGSVDLGPDARLGSFDSSKSHEAWLVVRSGPRTSVVVSDVVWNLRSDRLAFKLTGFAGGPKVPFFTKLFNVKDKPLLKKELAALASEPGMERIIVSHGELFEAGAKAALEQMAAAV